MQSTNKSAPDRRYRFCWWCGRRRAHNGHRVLERVDDGATTRVAVHVICAEVMSDIDTALDGKAWRDVTVAPGANGSRRPRSRRREPAAAVRYVRAAEAAAVRAAFIPGYGEK